MKKITYCLFVFLVLSVLWQTKGQTTHNLDWATGISSEDASLTIDVGDTVIWTFTDSASHSVTSDTESNESFDSGILTSGSTYQYTFTEEGVNDYHCDVHPSMVGTITVNAATVFGETCDAPIEISSLPYSTSDDTANYGDDYENESSPCSPYYMNGDDVIYSFTPADDAVVDISLTNLSATWSGIHVLDACVDDNPGCVAFRGNSGSSDRIIEDLLLTGGQTYYIVISTYATPQSVEYDLDIVQITCPEPIEVIVDNVMPTSADISWTATGSETEWEIIYGEEDFDPETDGTTLSDNDGTLGESLTSLSPETTYDVYVKAICGVDDESELSNSITFTTPPSCPRPTDLIVNNVTPTSAEVSWVAGGSETEWEVIYGEIGFDPESEGTTIIDNDGTLGENLPDLTPQVQYDVYVKAVCGVDDESSWAGPYTFGDYNALEVTGGFNEDVIANGVGDPSNTTTSLVDDDSYAYLSEDYQFSTSDEPAGFGLPVNGNLSEGPIEGLNFQMADYSSNNSLRIPTAGEENGGTLTFNNSQSASNLYIMATSGSGSSVMAGTITFEDNTTQEIPNTDIPDWYGGPANMTIISGLGRVNVTDGNAASNSSNPRIYQLEVSVDPANFDKVISSVNLYKESGDGIINIFGASIQFAPGCAEPSNITVENVTSDSADISWTAGFEETEWEILYGESGFDPETEGTSLSDDDGNLGETLQELAPDTEYEVYVKAICGADNESVWQGPISFYTGYCLIISTSSGSYIDNFVTMGGDADISNLDTGYAEDGYQDATDQFVSQSENLSVEFDADFVGTTVGFNIWIDWNNNLQFEDSEKVYASGAYVSDAVGTITVPDNTPEGNYRMRIRCDFNSTNPNACGESGSGRNETEDYTFTVIPQPPCPQPNDIVIDNITTTSADVNWTVEGNETEWEILYGEAGFNPETEGVSVMDTDETVGETLNSLSSGTDYEVYVRAICSSDEQSEWEGPESFSTECAALAEFSEFFDTTAEGEIPNCWNSLITNTTSSDAYIEVSEYDTPYSEPNNIDIYNSSDDSAEMYLVTPELLNLVDADHQLRFFYDGNSSVSLEVGTMTDFTDESTFTSIETLTTTDEYEEYTVLFDQSYTDNYIAFKVTFSSSYYDVFIDNVYWEPIPTCPKPTDLIANNITPSSAELSWTPGGSENEWEIIYGEAGFDPETEGQIVIDNDGNLGETINDLSIGTDYEFYVKAICGSDDESIWSNVGEFTSACDIYSLDYNEDFSKFVPNCWQVAGSGTPSEGPSSLNDSAWVQDEFLNGDEINQSARINLYTTGREEWLISPEINLSSPAELSYIAAITDYDNSNVPEGNGMGVDDEVQVLITIDGGTTWQNLRTYNQSEYPSETGDNETIDLSEYSGIVQIAFWGTDGSTDDDEDYDFFIDDFMIISTGEEFCLEPTDLIIENITDSSGDVSWTAAGDETEWEILYGESGFDPETEGISVMDTDGTIGETISPLMANTDYDVYVRAICSTDNISDWTGLETFTTEQLPCEVPTDLVIENITDSSADVSWTAEGDETEWEILYGEAGFDPEAEGTSVMDTDGTIGETISPLMANTDYDVYVRAICSTDNMSDWTGPETFTTEQLSCEMPTEVSIDNITENTADVTWTENGTATEWEILYGEAGFDPNSAGSSVMDTDGTIGETLTGLDPDTAYDVYVRAMCSTDDMSDWSEVESFTTEDLGVNDIAFQSLSLYPNPVKSNLTISAKSNVEQLELFSLLGQKVKTLSPNSTQTQLDLSGLSSGTYLLKVTINDSSKTFRIIKE